MFSVKLLVFAEPVTYDGKNATKETITHSKFQLRRSKEVAVHYMSGNDCFVSLPNGKSLYYGILPLLLMYSKERESVGHVSPLVSLMIDQRDCI